ncbi:SDR family oxidoreductase [Paenibacillus sp. FSL H8-0537]|uniref:SDR family oxidoreductase n=1 Tax=Paenibacillus sp. FSL H8-0537 TaxID=2921399 RepID=UPI0031016B03
MGVRSLTSVREREWGPDNINVNIVNPGEPYEDIAPVVVFLTSDDSRHITGQTFNVDGGASIHA